MSIARRVSALSHRTSTRHRNPCKFAPLAHPPATCEIWNKCETENPKPMARGTLQRVPPDVSLLPLKEPASSSCGLLRSFLGPFSTSVRLSPQCSTEIALCIRLVDCDIIHRDRLCIGSTTPARGIPKRGRYRPAALAGGRRSSRGGAERGLRRRIQRNAFHRSSPQTPGRSDRRPLGLG